MVFVKNEVLQKYISSKPSHVICIDISYFVKNKCYLIGIDLATRLVVGHVFKESYFQVNDVTSFLEVIFKVRKFTNAVEIVHSDRESLFKNDIYDNFLDSENVKISRGSSKGFDNQVVERLHRTIKFNVKKTLLNTEGFEQKTKNFSFNSVSSSQLKTTLNTVIEEYNNTPHSGNYKLSPNAMDEAFHNYSRKVIESGSTSDLKKVKLVKNDNSSDSVEVIKLRAEVANFYANDWVKFFLDWRNTAAIQNERLFKQNLELQKEVKVLRETLDYVADQTKIQEEIRHRRELAYQKRQLAAKLPVRDVVSNEEFLWIIGCVKTKSFSDCRRRLALVLLYLTGLRVSNLLVLNVNHLKSLFKKGKMVIPLIKGGGDRHSIQLGDAGILCLNSFKNCFQTICKDKKGNDFVFTGSKELTKAISRECFDKELNSILKKGSNKFGKHLRTHSFRASLITDLLVTTPIDVVKEFIGHNDIKSTLTYKRSRLTEDEIKTVIKLLEKTRKQG